VPGRARTLGGHPGAERIARPATFSPSTPDAMNNPANIIHRYTRAQALDDGTLTSANSGDLAAVTAQHFAGLTLIPPVAVAYYLMADMRAAARAGCDMAGIWHDILVIATAASNPSLNGTMARVFYGCLSNGPRRWSCTVRIGGHNQTVIIDIGPGDEGEPVVTFMAPNDD
jgi:hypothetical protein